MKIVFIGTPHAAVPSLKRLLDDGHQVVFVYTQPDRPSGRGNKITYSAVKQFAIERGLAVLQPAKVKTQEALDTFRSHGADIAVVVAYGRILPEGFLTAYPNGALNVHFSLLPKYRGAAPVNWAIVNGETETGVTTMNMDAGLDTGDILLQKTVKIGADENAVEIMENLSIVGADLLSETLVGSNIISPRAQDEAQATYAPIMRKENGLIDWAMPAAKIRDRIRGFQPFPTSYTSFRGSRLTIWKSTLVDIVDIEGSDNVVGPGTIYAARANELVIECGNGTWLRIDELQPEGKRRMETRDFINGMQPKIGEVLGQTA